MGKAGKISIKDETPPTANNNNKNMYPWQVLAQDFIQRGPPGKIVIIRKIYFCRVTILSSKIIDLKNIGSGQIYRIHIVKILWFYMI